MAVRIHKGSSWIFDLTPMIDCVFQLLIFFLVVARFAEEERELEVVLPQASQAVPVVGRPEVLYVSVSSDGRYFVGGRFVSLDHLHKILKQAGASNPGKQAVVIRADERCQWRHVVAVMDACQIARIQEYRVTTGAGSG